MAEDIQGDPSQVQMILPSNVICVSINQANQARKLLEFIKTQCILALSIHARMMCNKVSSTKSNLVKHVEENHSGKRHKCTDCKYESHSKNLLKLHFCLMMNE